MLRLRHPLSLLAIAFLVLLGVLRSYSAPSPVGADAPDVVFSADRAEAILRDAMRNVTEDDQDFGEIQYHLAECADRLGRPDEATARLRGLLADPRYADHARARVRTSYAHHLSEVAGERRAVLTAVSSLQDKPSRNEP